MEPNLPHNSEDRLSIRTNALQKSMLRRAAESRHMNVSQFVLQASLNEAERVLREESVLNLSPEAFQWVADLMDAPPAQVSRLREALNTKPLWDE